MTMHTRIEEGPDAIDLHVGLRLRDIRKAKGWSQEQLGEAVGISFQQVQKYERGSNRISMSRAVHLCEALECGVSDLLSGLSSHQAERATAAGFMPWAVTERGMKWIALGQRIAPEDFHTVASMVALVVRED